MSDEKTTAKTSWKRISSPFGSTNFILNGDGFYISFNPDPGANVLGAMFGSDDCGPETALVNVDKFYILDGDFRAAYERLVGIGYAACKAFYDQQSAHADSSWAS